MCAKSNKEGLLMKLKKVTALFLVSAMVIGSLAGCTKDTTTASDDAAATEAPADDAAADDAAADDAEATDDAAADDAAAE